MMKDIAKQMRHIAVKMDNPYEEYCIEAADEIERLRKENEQLKKENEDYHIKYVLGLTQGH